MKRVSLTVLLLILLAAFSGCTVTEIRRQSQLIGNAGALRGKVVTAGKQKGPVVVARYREDKGVFFLESMMPTNSRGEYRFVVTPGTYYVAAYIDSNKGGAYQHGEHWSYHGKPWGIPVAAGQTVAVETLTIAGESPALPTSVKVETRLAPAVANIGRVVRLDDPIFNRDNYSMGLWRPVDFLTQVVGGLLFLQNYEKDKIPVIFVHGANGGPTDLKNLVERLDRNRFQPWVLYYPSGLRLGMVSEYLVRDVAEAHSRYGFKQFAVVAHSMGGLVTRSFVKKYVQYPGRLGNLALVMTINSPMGGVPSAALGVNSPLMVQSWRDVSPGSDFLEELYAWSWPTTIPYYLVFSYKTGKDGDGVVSMLSQTPLELQQEAARMYGFNNDHVGTLNDEAFLDLFTTIIGTAVK